MGSNAHCWFKATVSPLRISRGGLVAKNMSPKIVPHMLSMVLMSGECAGHSIWTKVSVSQVVVAQGKQYEGGHFPLVK